MQGFAIVKMEADAVAVEEHVVRQFNEYMQHSGQTQSFVHDAEGYFRISYDDKTGISSAAVSAFGSFLQSSGYSVNGISTSATAEGEIGTDVSFEKGGRVGHVLLSTLRVY